MKDKPPGLLNEFNRGISRRQLLQTLSLAAVAAPVGLFAQGRCGGANAGTSGCNTTPLPPPFEPTKWKTVLLDHFSLQAVDPEKEAAFYNALMGWKVRSNDGKTIVMDIGTVGAVIIRGGLQVAPSASSNPRPPARAVFDNFCFGIEPWDTRNVEAELKKRGLNPVADHNGKDFFSFHVKDPDGFDLQISNGNRKNRRTTPANGKLNSSLPFEPTGWQTIYVNHISYGVTNYKETVAFYAALLGWKPTVDEGSQNQTEIAPEIGAALIRGGNPATPGVQTAVRHASIGHISFDIADFDPDKVNEGLLKRGLTARVDTGATADSPAKEKDIHTSTQKSYHTTTANGYDLQISMKDKR
jgi:predicted enzyme related to lactoylglutathione lyase